MKSSRDNVSLRDLGLLFDSYAAVPVRCLLNCTTNLKLGIQSIVGLMILIPHSLPTHGLHVVVQAYGMTEACHQISTQRLGFENSPGSVGWPNHDLEVCILDESWSEVEGSVEGRICLRGRQVTPGYLNNTSANASCFSDSGFFDTGDLGRKLSSGEVTLTGRMKEMVNCGGEKINPSEVEECIKSISSNVVNAVVFPVNDAILGEVPHAAVIYNTSELLDECAVQKIVIEGLQGVLASFKIPRKVYLTNKFNMSPVGKLQRSLVKKQFVKE
eukprot:GHVH01000606.1.p2 GENE.GHVH01000606.1~~GHVH01000606.1.p2  ORF type:complete len:272 (-),score=29.27 GHVH01000606.1:149-964(-)